MSGRDFDLGLQSAFLLLFKYCTAVFQMSWCLAPHLDRSNSRELPAQNCLKKPPAVWMSRIGITATHVTWATVYNSLHKRLVSLIVIIDMNVPYLHKILSGYCWDLRGESSISVSTWRFPLCFLSPILGYAIHLNYSIVYCCLNK